MAEHLGESKQKELLLNDNLDPTKEFNTSKNMMEEKNDDMFVSALDSPTDSGLAGLETLDNSTNENATTVSNTMEDLSLQDDEIPVEAVGDENKELVFTPPDDDVGVSEINLDDEDDDIFKSARLEPEPAKATPQLAQVSPTVTNGFSRSASEEPAETDIPLEDDEHPFEDAHLKPGLQLSGPSPTPATIPQQTLTSFHEEEAKREMEGGDEFIEIKVADPHKVGDGMSSYIAYKVVTNTNLSYFKKSKPEVNRRFSDFLGLRDKLSEKYLQNGRIIPPAPDKSFLGMTKIKLAKEEDNADQYEFVEKRRAALERYLNRTAQHPSLRVDPDFREFLELDAELP